MDNSFPDTIFDENGVCNYCKQIDNLKEQYGTGKQKGEEELQKIIQEHDIEKLIILEKSDSLNNLLPPFSASIATALYPLGTLFRTFIVGLGGRDVTRDELDVAKNKMKHVLDMKGQLYTYLGARESVNKIHEVQM